MTVGTLGPDSMRIDMDTVAGPSDLADLMDVIGTESRLFVGAYPGPDDSDSAVTLVVPDADGVIRHHPH
jgi:hypothetical protein